MEVHIRKIGRITGSKPGLKNVAFPFDYGTLKQLMDVQQNFHKYFTAITMLIMLRTLIQLMVLDLFTRFRISVVTKRFRENSENDLQMFQKKQKSGTVSLTSFSTYLYLLSSFLVPSLSRLHHFVYLQHCEVLTCSNFERIILKFLSPMLLRNFICFSFSVQGD